MSGIDYTSVNPATGEVLKKFEPMSDSQLSAALDKAQHTFDTVWKNKPVSERAQLLSKLADIIENRADEIAKLMSLEMGKLFPQAQLEAYSASAMLRYYAGIAEKVLSPRNVEGVEGAKIIYQPVGPLLAIEPWNFPIYQAIRIASSQLVAGNVILLKHAPNLPQCALLFEQLFKEAGFPEGVYTNIFCTNDQAGNLIDDFRIRGVALTGSERAGAAVAERAGRNIKKVILELGGSDPFIILEDASFSDAVGQAVMGRLVGAGQVCIAAKRFIVVGKERGEQFTQTLVGAFRGVKIGDQFDADAQLGPLVSKIQLDTLLSQLALAKKHGATILTGGNKVDRKGYFLEPTVITGITPENPVAQQEFFGPIASVYVVDTEEEAIKLANSTKYGLGATIFTGDVKRAEEVIAPQIEAGMVWINSMMNPSAELPFGGCKNSGFGRELGELGLLEFVTAKVIRSRL